MSVKSQFGDITVPAEALHQFMFKKFANYGLLISMIDGRNDVEYTYQDIIRTSQKIASGLVKLGITKGDVVAIYSYNTPEWVLMFWGILCAGATATTLNHTYTKYELEHQLRDSGAKLVYTVKDLLSNCQDAVGQLPSVKKIIVLGSTRAHTNEIDFNILANDDGSEWAGLEKLTYDVRKDVAAIPYSSGTTGLPKGVMLTHYNIVANCLQTGHKEMVDPAHERDMSAGIQTVLMGIMPFYHVYGLVFAMCKRMGMGDKVVIMPKFEPRSFLRAIEKHKVTFLSLVPPIVNFIAKTPLLKEYDLSSVNTLGNAAAPLSKYMEEEFKAKMHINEMKQGFGLTESTCSVCSYGYKTPYRPRSCGKLIPSTEAMIVDTSSGKILGSNEVGEMWFRGPQIMKGYLNKPEATRQTVDADGWLHTGDIGYYDNDHYFYVVDRIKELIKVKGFQVAPAELEALLLSHPSVNDAGVVGVADDRSGEIPRAFVVKKTGVSVTEKELCDYVKERTAPFKHLKGGVKFIPHVPRLPSGKILRRKLKENSSKL